MNDDFETAPLNEEDAAWQYAATHQDDHPNAELDDQEERS